MDIKGWSYLVEEILKHEVVVIIAGGELHILESRGKNPWERYSKCYSYVSR